MDLQIRKAWSCMKHIVSEKLEVETKLRSNSLKSVSSEMRVQIQSDRRGSSGAPLCFRAPLRRNFASWISLWKWHARKGLYFSYIKSHWKSIYHKRHYQKNASTLKRTTLYVCGSGWHNKVHPSSSIVSVFNLPSPPRLACGMPSHPTRARRLSFVL